MKKLVYIVLVIVMIASCSQEQQAKTTVDDTLPEYDIEQYCQKCAEDSKKDDIKGVYSLSEKMFNHCFKEEKADYEWLKSHWDLLSSKSKVYCKQAIDSSRKHYEVLKVCTRAVTCEEDNNNLTICIGQKKLKDILDN